ncbi:MAG: hypothetical protein AAF865_14380 [Pseudomonadota bacterium]
MARQTWHILRDGESLTVSRRLPVRWDVAGETDVPGARRRLRLAHQIRQDLWRALRRQRGFSPAVEVRRAGPRICVRAGGRIEGPFNRCTLEARIAVLLADDLARARWVRHAGGGV